ncbi:hypothetical protein HQ585_02695 [candidate division KSB1 bacterium]|nr:hypothetical protein [candidate division KSB1 bacterium]
MTDQILKPPQIRPGTVSDILWHFTGGPKWNEKEKRQEADPKPSSEAYERLCSILTEDTETGKRILKVGGHREVVFCKSKLEFHFGKKIIILNAGDVLLESSPVCCLAEIPIVHLNYVSVRYRKFAIGFYRKTAIKNQFNPVLYTFESSSIAGAIRTLSENIESLQGFPEWFKENVINDEKNPDFSSQRPDLKEAYHFLSGAVEPTKPSFERILSFIKTIKENELESIYCEREWRSTQDFRFTCDDVAMIVLPKKMDDDNTPYFDKFIEEEIDRLSIPRKIPIIAWEDLIEH